MAQGRDKTVWGERTGSVGDQGEATEEREEAACARRERERVERVSWRENK